MNSVKNHFSKTVLDYDTISDKVVMKNDELHMKIIRALPFSPNDSFTLLDLGCGTGHGLAIIASKFKNCRITGIDFSQKMIEKCKKNLEKFNNKELLCSDFTAFSFPSQTYDAVISAVAIHNIAHDKKKILFSNICKSLKDGGIFVNGDFTEGETEEINRQYLEAYKKYLGQALYGEELAVWLNHAFMDDKPMKLSLQFELLKNCGFDKISKIWQFESEAVYLAKKPISPGK